MYLRTVWCCFGCFLKPKIFIYQDHLRPLRDLGKSGDQDLTADAFRRLAVCAGSVLYAWGLDAEPLRVDGRGLIFCAAHGIGLGLDHLVHAYDRIVTYKGRGGRT